MGEGDRLGGDDSEGFTGLRVAEQGLEPELLLFRSDAELDDQVSGGVGRRGRPGDHPLHVGEPRGNRIRHGFPIDGELVVGGGEGEHHHQDPAAFGLRQGRCQEDGEIHPHPGHGSKVPSLKSPRAVTIFEDMASRVLYVDDEPALCKAFERALRGHALVTTMTSASAAIVLLATEQFDVVASDYRMAEATGVEVLGIARARWPTTRTILVSGQVDSPEHDETMTGFDAFLRKPWSLDELRRLLRELTHHFVGLGTGRS